MQISSPHFPCIPIIYESEGDGALIRGRGGGGRLMDIVTHGMGVYSGKGTYSRKYATRI